MGRQAKALRRTVSSSFAANGYYNGPVSRLAREESSQWVGRPRRYDALFQAVPEALGVGYFIPSTLSAMFRYEAVLSVTDSVSGMKPSQSQSLLF